MTLTNSIPSTFMTPGATVEFDITSGARGLVPLVRRVALIGVRTSAGTVAAGVTKQIFADSDGDTYFGKNGELAVMCRAALKAGRKAGRMPEVYAIGVTPPAGNAATRTLTVTGPATAAGNVRFSIAGRHLSAAVANGDSANTVAASIKAAIDAVAATGDLPGTAGVATNVVTFTLAQIGVNGEDITISVESAPTGVAVVVATGVAGTGAYDITTTVDALVDKHYNAVAIAGHTSAEITDLLAHIAARSLPGVKKWPFAFVAVKGSLSTATTLATAANSEFVVITNMEDCPAMPGEIAAHVAVSRMAIEDPSLTVSGMELDLPPPPAASVFTEGQGGEIESALAGGVTPLHVSPEGRVYIVRLITTKTTLGGAPYTLLRDFGVIFTLTWLAEQADTLVRIFKFDARNKKMLGAAAKRLRSRLLDMLRQAEAKEYIHNVDAHKNEVQVEPDATVPQRMNYDIPASVVPGLEQAAGVVRVFLENAAA